MNLSPWLHELTWEEIGQRAEAGGTPILVPIGSTEQHGPHLPTGTDTFLAIALAESATRATDALIAPPIWYGWSPHHMVLPGTITVRPEVLIDLVSDVVGSLSQHGFDRFVLLNGHRIANLPWLQLAAERAQRTLGVKVALFDPAYMSKEVSESLGWGEIGHAEEIETSHLLHIDPHRVRMDRAVDAPPPEHALYHVDPRNPGDTLAYVPASPNEQQPLALRSRGVSGSPNRASPEKGKRYHEHLVARLVAVIQALEGEMPCSR